MQAKDKEKEKFLYLENFGSLEVALWGLLKQMNKIFREINSKVLTSSQNHLI